MRLIFSRKGFDSASGGGPSPLLGDRPVSFPIPSSQEGDAAYADLPEIGELIADLGAARTGPFSRCHLDPDLVHGARPRQAGWRGSLGQVGAAQGHLARQGVGADDLFLFWGLFRPAVRRSRWMFEGPPVHCVFGWLQIDRVLWVGSDPTAALTAYPWLEGHPHLVAGRGPSNTVYLARERLDCGVDRELPGWGTFSRALRLTAPDASAVSRWRVPDWLNPTRGGTGMSYHPPNRWSTNGLLHCAARGQEFVAEVSDREDARVWLGELFRSAA